MNARDHAREFLLPIDPRHSIRSIGKAVLDAAETDERIAKKLDAIQTKLGDGKPVIGDEHSALYERIKCARAIPNIPTAPEWLRPLLAVGYLRAKAGLAARPRTNIYERLDEGLDKILKLIDDIEDSFIGELLVETVQAARDDNGFARTLQAGATEFSALVDELYGEPDDPAGGPVASARRAGGGRGSCTCCRTVNGQTTCESCSCWIIVVIIVIIIIVK